MIQDKITPVCKYRKATSVFSCRCSLCCYQVKKRYTFVDKKQEPIVKHEYQTKSFLWLVKKLSKASEAQQIHLNFPEIAVFSKRSPKFILCRARDLALKKISQPEKLKTVEIVKFIVNIVRNRKKEAVLVNKTYPNNKINDVNDFFKEAAFIRYASKDAKEGPIRIFNESEFTELVWERSNSPIWKDVEYIQSMIPSTHSSPKPVFYDYFALSEYKIVKAVYEKVNGIESPLVASLEASPEDSYLDVCNKIAYHVSLVSYYEIKFMQVEFLKDSIGQLWVVNIRNIQVEKFDIEIRTLKETFLEKHFLALEDSPHSPKVKQIIQMIDKFYEKEGISDLLEPIVNEEPLIEQSTNKIRFATPKIYSRQHISPIVHTPEIPKKTRSWKYHPKVRLRPSSKCSRYTPAKTFFKSMYKTGEVSL